MRGSPLKRGPEDMPLPSIETASSDIATPRKDERRSAHEEFSHSQEFYPRRVVDQRLQSPAARQVIVINDDSPPVKRRRMVYADDSGSFRPAPSRDYGLHVSAPHSASHLILTPSAQSDDFLVRRPAASSYSAPGLMRRPPEFYTDPVTAERLPIYDASAPAYMASRPEYTRRVEAEPSSGLRVEDRSERPTGYSLPNRDNIVDGTFARNSIRIGNGSGVERYQEEERDNVRQIQTGYNHGARAVRPMSPKYSVSQPFRSQYGAHSSNGPDQDFIHSFSQSRLDGTSSQARDGFTVNSERPYHQNIVDDGNHPRYQAGPARSVMSGVAPRARSPIRYLARPM